MQLTTHPVIKWWNQFWKKKQVVDLSPTSLKVKQSQSEIDIPLDTLINLSIEKGIFLYRLIVESEGNDVVILKGYRKSELMNFTQKTTDSLLLLVVSSDRWQSYQQSLEALNTKCCYLSSYEWQPIAVVYQLVCKLQNLGISADHLSNPYISRCLNKLSYYLLKVLVNLVEVYIISKLRHCWRVNLKYFLMKLRKTH
ncbi:hypothetical protein C9J20_02225 [Photobacterium phosphoreum]|uniref:hypothetical protein n=1 Tax=Photobacterium phosphoreum TaxID=659 RepID=UPI000D169D7E|nr:hypothetical protein [Photobacterium phosphoreum]PSU67218.1 hypothetical protein CTM79_16815 [Photobacterium phosphoreum]PSW17414.1 hypothetical protein C9J20_02225 [Photobacterium phosphoreum]